MRVRLFNNEHCTSRRGGDLRRRLISFAILPLVLFNGSTVIGCGCSGQFEPACHCSSQLHSLDSESAAIAKGNSPAGASRRSCCQFQQRAVARSLTANKGKATHQDVDCRHCISAARQEAMTASSSPSDVVDDCLAAPLACATYILAAHQLSARCPCFQLDTGHPPNDLVVSLHRLVI